jgi:two-component system phosphate regulon sensor histidine kinase PhoR
MRRSFFWKLFLGFVAPIVLAAALASLVLERVARAAMLDDAHTALRNQAALLAELARPALAPGGDPTLEPRLRALGRVTATRFTVLRADGVVIADSEREPDAMDNHLRRSEIAAAAAQGEGFAERTSGTTGAGYFYFALAVEADGERLGFVRAATPTTAIQARLASLRRYLVLGATAAALLGLTLSAVLARRISAPVSAVTELAEHIAAGDYHRAARFEKEGELGRLARAVETMTAQLEERLQTITADRNKVLAILSSMVEGVIAVDREQRVVHINAVAGRLLGLDPASCLERRIWEATRAAPVCDILDATLADSVERASECRIPSERRGAGGDCVLELRASPLRDGSGALSGAVLVLHDVTALRRLENVRRDFVGNVSHELKTPLTAVRALVETILDDASMPAETRRRFLEKIREQAGRLSTLVGDLLTLARIESNEAPIERRALDVREVVRECASRIAPACEKKGLTLETSVPGEPVILRSDEESLRQILDNLLDNACKYTPSGGRVRVRIERGAAEVALEVEDDGIGIDLRDQERVFERFYRVDKARSRELGGTGLGLSIVKHLASALGGRVSLDSALGRGSTFRVHFPCGGGSASAPA